MFLFKCVWSLALGVTLMGLGYIVAPLDWLRKLDRRGAQNIEQRRGRRAVSLYFRTLGVVMFVIGGFITVGLISAVR